MKERLFVRTFGCQANEYDSTKMADFMRANKVESTTDINEATIVVLNTCSVREKAQEKIFSDLGRYRHLKEKKPDLIIGVGGCVASQEGDQIIRRAPYVDVVFGPQTLHRLPQLIDKRRQSGKPQVDISFPEIEKFDCLPPPTKKGPSAFVSIMEGCSKYCSFCVVPYTRGEEISRPLAGILKEINQLAQLGVREITLLGQNVNAYRVTHEGADIDFATLLTCVNEISGIDRIRFTTSHPIEFSDRLIAVYEQLQKLPDYLHLPVQSGSDRVLARMKRGYTCLEYKSIIRRLRKVRPNIVISSDFIVGFPGESDEDFEKTMQLVDDVGFDFSYSFIYSVRPGTPAASFEDTTPMAVKKQRLARLQERLEENGRRFSQTLVGLIEPVLIEGVAKRGGGYLQGRTPTYRVVNLRAEECLIGEIRPVRIVDALAHTLRGEIVNS